MPSTSVSTNKGYSSVSAVSASTGHHTTGRAVSHHTTGHAASHNSDRLTPSHSDLPASDVISDLVSEMIRPTHDGFHTAAGVTGVHHTIRSGPTYGNKARRVDVVDGTSARHNAHLDDPTFRVKVASRSDSVSEIAFPTGAVEIEQHYYKGEVLEEEYGQVQDDHYEIQYRDVPVYRKEIDEVIKRERVINTIVDRVPVYNYIDNIIEVEHIVDRPIYKEVPIKKTVVKQIPKAVREQRLIEKVRYVPVTEEVEIERIVEIPGEILIQPRHVVRDDVIITDKHLDKEVPVVISQVVTPIMKDTKKKVRVPAKVLTPDLSTATVRVPKPVDLEFHQSEVKTVLKHHQLSDADYNSAFFQLNGHLTIDHRKALRAGHHVKICPNTGRPVMRDRNLNFYRIPESELSHVEGWVPKKKAISCASSTTSSVSTSDIAARSQRSAKPSHAAGSQYGGGSHYAASTNASHQNTTHSTHHQTYMNPGSKYVTVAR